MKVRLLAPTLAVCALVALIHGFEGATLAYGAAAFMSAIAQA